MRNYEKAQTVFVNNLNW